MIGVAAGCADSPPSGPAARGRYTHADSVRLGVGQRVRPTLDAAPADPTCDPSSGACPTLVSVTPGYFQGADQPSPIELSFTGPVGQITVVGDGAISCSGTFGTIVGYGADGTELGRAALQLIDPSDCSPPDWPDNVTYGAQGTLVTTSPIARAVIEPMSLLTFPVFDLVGRASATYTVTYGVGPVAAKPELVVSCAPNPVGRDQDVTCTGQLKNGPDYTLVERRAKGKGFSIVETPNQAVTAGQSFEWKGKAVAKTEVKFKVSWLEGGKTKTAEKSATFEITPRGWPEMKLTAAPQHKISLHAPILIDYPTNRTLGFFWFEDPMPSATPPAQVAGGPNAGLWYLSAPVTMPQDIHAFTHPGMYASHKDGRKWYDDQNNQGSGTCLQTVLPTLASKAEVHEGVGMQSNSHYGVANVEFTKAKLHEKFEQLYTSKSAAELGKAADKIYENFRKTYLKAQNTFDSVDRPKIFGSLGCTLDFDPTDK